MAGFSFETLLILPHLVAGLQHCRHTILRTRAQNKSLYPHGLSSESPGSKPHQSDPRLTFRADESAAEMSHALCSDRLSNSGVAQVEDRSDGSGLGIISSFRPSHPLWGHSWVTSLIRLLAPAECVTGRLTQYLTFLRGATRQVTPFRYCGLSALNSVQSRFSIQSCCLSSTCLRVFLASLFASTLSPSVFIPPHGPHPWF
ncbi:hypothetical protein JZ751_018891 [Albula glossodonta]|uniref:Secreted protein n=1 Tax=Albula glossodonta TaxID=121402 RepID=A0A8T2MWB1_9TELE|nr:hypothetical protein JZ751_018891 [Albula glossodonta]